MKFVKRLLMAVGFVGIFYPVLQVYMPLSEFTDLTGSFLLSDRNSSAGHPATLLVRMDSDSNRFYDYVLPLLFSE